MASTNQSPEYQKAEGKFLSAETKEKKLKYLKEMIRECPKHKSAEKMLANLKTRYRKLKYANEKEIKKKKSGKEGIKKEDMQAVIVGTTNTGKSSLLSALTNAQPKIAAYDFTTKKPIVGMMQVNGVKIQLVEIPAFESEYYDRGIVHTADTILILITNLEQIKSIEKELESAKGKKIIIFNKTNQNPEEARKISATLQSRKYDHQIISTKNRRGIEELKEKIFQSFNKIRVYTKEPGKEPDRKKPIILDADGTVKQAAEKILHGFSSRVLQTKIWGPSSKFPEQIVGLNHKLKDLDVVEFKTK